MHAPDSFSFFSAARTHGRHAILLLLFALPHVLHAQSLPRCSAADLDPTFRFASYPPSTYLVVIFSRNLSTRACTLTAPTAPDFGLAYPDPANPIRICAGCDQPHPAAPSLTLNPGETAHQTLRWSSAPAPGSSCQRLTAVTLPINGDLAHTIRIAAPTLLPPVCSQVDAEPYATGPIFGDEDSTTAPATIPSTDSLRISSYRLDLFPGESFSLHAEGLAAGDPSVPPRNLRCPTFFVRQRAGSGSTHLDQLPIQQVRCMRQFIAASNQAFDPEHPNLTASFDAIPQLHDPDSPNTSVQLLSLACVPRDSVLQLASSNIIAFHISDTGAPQSTSGTPSSLTAYTGWKANFTLANTSFGKNSALIDQSTHLEWLALDLTRNKSPESLDRDMSHRKPLDGWRFATDDEVVTLFRHFTGSSTGYSTDPAIVHELQLALGGPLGASESHAGGWTRAFTYGRIVDVYQLSGVPHPCTSHIEFKCVYIMEQTPDNGDATALANPRGTGPTSGNNPATGTFLVRPAP